VFQDIIRFMRRLEEQGRFRRFARQDNNKSTIEDLTRSLENAMVSFDVSFLITWTFIDAQTLVMGILDELAAQRVPSTDGSKECICRTRSSQSRATR
jgi:hypothetical protein